jgi:hypothetical protein
MQILHRGLTGGATDGADNQSRPVLLERGIIVAHDRRRLERQFTEMGLKLSIKGCPY